MITGFSERSCKMCHAAAYIISSLTATQHYWSHQHHVAAIVPHQLIKSMVDSLSRSKTACAATGQSVLLCLAGTCCSSRRGDAGRQPHCGPPQRLVRSLLHSSSHRSLLGACGVCRCRPEPCACGHQGESFCCGMHRPLDQVPGAGSFACQTPGVYSHLIASMLIILDHSSNVCHD